MSEQRFSSDELQWAIVALDRIDRDGNRDEWAYVLRQASDSAPAAGRWGNATPGQKISGQILAGKLANLLGVDPDRCDEVAAEMFAPQRHRVIFDALLGYAAELGQPSHRESRVTPKPTQRPSIRIVGDDERGVA